MERSAAPRLQLAEGGKRDKGHESPWLSIACNSPVALGHPAFANPDLDLEGQFPRSTQKGLFSSGIDPRFGIDESFVVPSQLGASPNPPLFSDPDSEPSCFPPAQAPAQAPAGNRALDLPQWGLRMDETEGEQSLQTLSDVVPELPFSLDFDLGLGLGPDVRDSLAMLRFPDDQDSLAAAAGMPYGEPRGCTDDLEVRSDVLLGSYSPPLSTDVGTASPCQWESADDGEYGEVDSVGLLCDSTSPCSTRPAAPAQLPFPVTTSRRSQLVKIQEKDRLTADKMSALRKACATKLATQMEAADPQRKAQLLQLRLPTGAGEDTQRVHVVHPAGPRRRKRMGRPPKNAPKPRDPQLPYTAEERRQVAMLYRQSRAARVFLNKGAVRYKGRSDFALSRARIGGRFVKRSLDVALQALDEQRKGQQLAQPSAKRAKHS